MNIAQDVTQKDTEVIVPCLRIVTKVSKWNQYQFIKANNGIYYVRGYNEKPVESYQWVDIENGTLLFSLMQLYRDIFSSCNEIFSINQNYVNGKINQDVVQLILKFCKKHGLPFWNTKINSNIFQNEETRYDNPREKLLSGISCFDNMNMFPICSFLSGLLHLHMDFLNLVAFKKWEYDDFLEGVLTDDDRKFILEKCNRKRLDLYTPCLCNFSTEWNSRKKCLQMQSENLMAVAAYHLCILYQSTNIHGTGGYWKICETCGQIFYASRSNQKYCYNPCTKGAAYMRRKRGKALS